MVVTDEELLGRAPSDADAFATFYRSHARPLTGFLVARTRNPEVAADLVAETFAAALESCHRYRADRAPSLAC